MDLSSVSSVSEAILLKMQNKIWKWKIGLKYRKWFSLGFLYRLTSEELPEVPVLYRDVSSLLLIQILTMPQPLRKGSLQKYVYLDDYVYEAAFVVVSRVVYHGLPAVYSKTVFVLSREGGIEQNFLLWVDRLICVSCLLTLSVSLFGKDSRAKTIKCLFWRKSVLCVTFISLLRGAAQYFKLSWVPKGERL